MLISCSSDSRLSGARFKAWVQAWDRDGLHRLGGVMKSGWRLPMGGAGIAGGGRFDLPPPALVSMSASRRRAFADKAAEPPG